MNERVGVRELQHHVSRVLKRVKEGETVEVTERGRLVAIMSPPSAETATWESLLASGAVTEGKGGLDDWEPLPSWPDTKPLSQVLIEMREEEGR